MTISEFSVTISNKSFFFCFSCLLSYLLTLAQTLNLVKMSCSGTQFSFSLFNSHVWLHFPPKLWCFFFDVQEIFLSLPPGFFKTNSFFSLSVLKSFLLSSTVFDLYASFSQKAKSNQKSSDH